MTRRNPRENNSKARVKRQRYKNYTPLIFLLVGIIFVIVIVLILTDFGKGSPRDTVSAFEDIIEPVKKEVIRDNVYIEGLNVGGMTKEEALEAVVLQVPSITEGELVNVKSSDGRYSYSFSYEDLGAVYDIKSAVDNAFNYGRDISDNISTQEQRFKVFTYDEEMLANKVREIGQEVDVRPVNASAIRSNGMFVVSPASSGQEVEESDVIADIKKLLDNCEFGKEVIFDIKEKLPEVVEEDFDKVSDIIGSFKSPYKGGDQNRITNLRNACDKLNDVVIYPGEVFSTNDRFNPCTYENGWRNAATIVNGKIEDSIGGGMCQVSSALYDAVLYAELEIVERHNHSLKVAYSDYAFDATLAGDYKDFKFKNNTDYPIYMESYLSNSNVVVNIYGYEVHSPNRKVVFKNKFINSTEPEAPLIKYDDTLPEGTEKTETTALKGQKYELYKYVYENGVLIDTVFINKSIYKPRRAEIVKGTKTVEETTEAVTEAASDVTTTEVLTEEAPVEVITEEIIQ